MAKQVITMLTDDLDGGEAAETVKFALDGTAYEIDLSERNAQELRAFLERYQHAGTRTGRMPASGAVAYTPNRGQGRKVYGSGTDHPSFRENKELNNAIRTWAGENGYDVAERGRIPQHVVDNYHKGIPAQRVQPEVVIPGTELPVEELAPSTTRQPARKAAPAVSFKPGKTPTKATPAKATRSRAARTA